MYSVSSSLPKASGERDISMQCGPCRSRAVHFCHQPFMHSLSHLGSAISIHYFLASVTSPLPNTNTLTTSPEFPFYQEQTRPPSTIYTLQTTNTTINTKLSDQRKVNVKMIFKNLITFTTPLALLLFDFASSAVIDSAQDSLDIRAMESVSLESRQGSGPDFVVC